jgi:hypothetical protein
MTAQVIILPVVRKQQFERDDQFLQIGLPKKIYRRLKRYADKSDGNVEATAQAFLIFALAAAEQMSPQEFTKMIDAEK